MASIKDLANKYVGIIKSINETREENCLVIAKDGFALVANRIQNTGVSAEGANLTSYSHKPIRWWLLNPNEYTSAGKIEKFKKNAQRETQAARKEGREVNTDKVSYYGLRKAYGLPVDKKTLTFTAAMFSDIVQVVEEKTATSVTIVIKAKSKEEQRKVNVNSNREKTNILALSKEEIKIVEEANKKRIETKLKL